LSNSYINYEQKTTSRLFALTADLVAETSGSWCWMAASNPLRQRQSPKAWQSAEVIKNREFSGFGDSQP
jgi:hypothetical protein